MNRKTTTAPAATWLPMRTPTRPWLRFLEGVDGGQAGDGGTTPPADQDGGTPDPDGQGSAPGGEEGAPESFTREQVDKMIADALADKQEENPDGRGSKREVLADLARERDKRQAVEAERDTLKADADKLAEVTAERDALAEQLQKQQQEITEKQQADQRAKDIDEALTAAKLPAEMADRLRGETAEELLEDAKKLASTLGYDRRATDPFQGQGRGGKTAPTSLAGAISDHYRTS